jgi:transposase
MGRPTKFNEERAQMMLEALRGGNYIETAAEYAGIDDSTYRRWMQREEPEFRAFRAAVKKALADAEVRNVGIVLKAASAHWQAAAWWLERRLPAVYGRRTRVEADVNVTAKPVVDVSKLTLDEQRTLLELLRKGQPNEAELPAGTRPALESMPGEAAA